MGGAAGFLWLAVVILALGSALQFSGAVNLGMNLSFWLPVLLVLALLGAIFNMFVMPFMGRSRTTRTAAAASGTAAPAVAAPVAAAPVAPAAVTTAPVMAAPAAGAAEQEVVTETRDRPSF